jgi:hypothetical protein
MARLDYSARWKRLNEKVSKFTSTELVRIVNKATREVRDMIVQRYMGGAARRPPSFINRLARNTGNMEKKTVARRAVATDQGISASINIGVPYASVHFSDDGRTETVIRPKRAQALAVPTLTSPVGPDHRPILRAGSPLITKKFSHDGVMWGRLPGRKTEPLFLMRGSVTVPARVNVQRDIQPRANKILVDLIEEAFKKRFQ